MRVGWVLDRSDVVGGAELTQAAFGDTGAPDGTLIADCCPDTVWPEEVDVWVVHNCTQFGPELVDRFGDTPVVKYHHDVGPHINPLLREWLLTHAVNVFCSPAQHEFMRRAHGPYRAPKMIPPAMNLQAFRDAGQHVRQGTVWLGNMTNYGKGIRQAVEWAETHGPVSFYGDGPLRPEGVNVHDCGPVDHADVPDLLGAAERFVFLPTALEPFGRVVAEAWAAGCRVVTNNNVGARHWIESRPEALDTAAEDFWRLVTEAAA